MKVIIKKLPHGEDLPLPHYATPGSAGLDLLAATDKEIDLAPGAVIALSGVVAGGLFVEGQWSLAASALAGLPPHGVGDSAAGKPIDGVLRKRELWARIRKAMLRPIPMTFARPFVAFT